MLLTWLATELRAAGLRVVEVDGWKTRGSNDFDPIGVTWHATAGSRTATAQGEVNVILNGSATAPPPIAQLMLWRDGTVYVCAAGRCNHNKVGWDGPNKGYGNTRLLGIEMANDNKGEPWPTVQLDAARRATAVIMRRLGADPMKRLAAHYEHQPYATRPPGETSTKTDPVGVDMKAERPRVAALMTGDNDMPLTSADVEKIWETDGIVSAPPNSSTVGTNPFWAPKSFLTDTASHVRSIYALLQQVAAKVGADPVDEQAIIQGVLAGLPASAIAAAIPKGMAAEVVSEVLAKLPKANADEILRRLQA